MFDFPASPSNGQEFTPAGGPTYIFNGSAWMLKSVAGVGPMTYPAVGVANSTGSAWATSYSVAGAGTALATQGYVDGSAPLNVGRNQIHNGAFVVVQRGMGPWTQTDTFTVDRWYLDILYDTTSLSAVAATDAIRTAVGDWSVINTLNTTFTGSPDPEAYTCISQRMESVRRLAGKTVVVSFYAAASSALKLGVNVRQWYGSGGGSTQTIGAGAAVQLTTAWARYSLSFNIAGAAGKIVGVNNNDFTQLNFWYSTGANYATPSGGIGVQSGTVSIWGVQLEVSNGAATPFETLDPQYIWMACRRFYQTGNFRLQAGVHAAGMYVSGMIGLPVAMKFKPLMTSNFTTTTNATNPSCTALSATVLQAYCTGTATGAVDLVGTFTAAADI